MSRGRTGSGASKSLNWTNVGLKYRRPRRVPIRQTGLNWTNVGLKFREIARSPSREKSFELD